ncbi:MAG TPA: hypothetical protein VFM74_00500, partial [Candidatus Limnocylindria bacterium]|nr:hypothetical protein [Candidatus Limnocylindria bacterium]
MPTARPLVLVIAVALSACATPSTAQPPSTPPASSSPSGSAAPASPIVLPSQTGRAGAVLTASYEVPPAPGPVKPWRGEMTQHVQVADGYATMLFTLKNTGEEPVTFLNLLYDYEPRNLYDPM